MEALNLYGIWVQSLKYLVLHKFKIVENFIILKIFGKKNIDPLVWFCLVSISAFKIYLRKGWKFE